MKCKFCQSPALLNTKTCYGHVYTKNHIQCVILNCSEILVGAVFCRMHTINWNNFIDKRPTTREYSSEKRFEDFVSTH